MINKSVQSVLHFIPLHAHMPALHGKGHSHFFILITALKRPYHYVKLLITESTST